MTKNLPAITNEDKRVAAALHLHATATGAASQMAVAAAKCGLELKAIKKELGTGNWVPWFEAHLEKAGLTLRTGQRYMALADGLKGKALRNDNVSFLALLDSAPSKLSQAEQKTLTKEVSKITDGKALSELYQDFGISKKPQGAGAKGGKAKEKDDDTSESTEDAGEVAAAGNEAQTQQLIDLLTEGLADKWWNVCNTATRKKLHGLLVDVQAAVKETLT